MRMLEFQRRGVQEQPVQPGFRQLPVKVAIAVTIVKGDRMPGMLGMNANLVRTSGHRATANQCGERIALFHFKARFRRFAFTVNAHNPLAALQNIFEQRRLNHFHM